jgi:hypothetical protein
MTKYNATPTVVDGIRFASKREASRYAELKLLEAAGQIRHLRCHPRYEIIPAFERNGERHRAAHYTADFEYRDLVTGEFVAEDVKGGRATQTTATKLRAKLFMLRYPDYVLRIVD